MVTSSAVVGSSAISSFGSLVSAIAIIARWRIPPENSCGYSPARRSASGIPTSPSSSTARVDELDLAFKALPREGGEADPIFTSGDADSWDDFK